MTTPERELPLVSICIPTYNGEGFLEKSLDSALSQTYSNIEIIVSDDESTDRTVEIAKSFQEKSAIAFSVLPHQRNGLVDNWNFCIGQASGKYIKYLFQDDLLEPDCIAEMVDLAEQDDAIGLVFSPRQVLLTAEAEVDPDCVRVYQACTDIHKAWSNLQNIQSGRDLLADPKVFDEPLNKIGEPSTVLIRKEVFKRVGLFDPALSQLIDVDMWFRIAGHYKIGFIDRVLSTFQIHLNQQTQQNVRSKSIFLDSYRLYTKILHSQSYSFATFQWKEIVSHLLLDRIIWGETELRQTQEVFRQAQRDYQQEIEQLRNRLYQTQAELDRDRATLQSTQADLFQAKGTIEAMQSSKFWKLRQHWFNLKKSIGLPI